MNTPAPKSAHEQEWQFTAAQLDGARAWLAARPRDRHERRFEPRPTLELADTYYDSPDWMIYRAGFALRLRHSRGEPGGDTTEVTLKSLDPSRDALASRTELSQRVTSADMDSVLAQPEGIGERIRDLVGHRRVSVLFHARTRRERQHLLEADSELPLAEVDLDETVIESPTGQSREMSRVEIECLNAEPAALGDVVQALRDSAELKPVEGSKFRAGLEVAGIAPAPPELGSRTIDAAQPVSSALLAILRRYYAAILEAEPPLRLGEAAAVHDMRVATRHIDAVLRAFGDFVPGWVRDAHGAVRSLAKALGAVRDADVQLEHVDAQRRSHAADAAALLPLRERIAGERDRARAQLLRELNSPPQRAWQDSWLANLRDPDASAVRDAGLTGGVARDAIRRQARKLRKRADALDHDSSADDYHRVRSRSKRLRYLVEAFESLYGPPAEEYRKSLSKLQDVLGAYHDAVVREQRFTELAAGAALPAATSFAVGRLVERNAGAPEACRRKFPKAYKRVRKRRWRALSQAMRRQAHAGRTP